MASPFDSIISQIQEYSEKNFNTTSLPEQTIFNSFSTLEYYPLSKLLVLHAYLSDLAIDHPLANPDRLLKKEEEPVNNKVHSQLSVLNRILNLPDSFPFTVMGDKLVLINAYGYKSELCKGRMYGHINTMVRLSRQCRYYLFKDSYFDIDLSNAHPTILLAYAKSNNIRTNILDFYVSNREEFLGKIVVTDKITRSEAKKQVLRCLNLVSDISVSNTLKPLQREVAQIRNHLYKTHMEKEVSDLGRYTMSKDSFKGKTLEAQKISLQSQYCASEESRCVEILYEVCLHKGNLTREVAFNKASRNISFIPFFDGAYLLFEGLRNKSEVFQIINDTNELIYPNKFVLKEFEAEWKYIVEEDLLFYEEIVSFLNSISNHEMLKLLEYIEVPPFSLDATKFKDVITSINTPEEKKKFRAGLNEEVNILINDSAKTFKYTVRRKILAFFKQNRQTELFKHVRATETE